MSRKPYKPCPRCGANLDPGEKCDCRDIEGGIGGASSIFETYICGYDFSENKDETVLAIARREDSSSLKVIGTIVGEEAEKIYELFEKGCFLTGSQFTSIYKNSDGVYVIGLDNTNDSNVIDNLKACIIR